MRKNQTSPSTAISTITMLLAMFVPVFVSGCGQDKADGTVLILELENSENVHQYWVFNPYNHTIEECKATADQAIAEILASTAVPKDSKVTSWRCSFKPPESGG